VVTWNDVELSTERRTEPVYMLRREMEAMFGGLAAGRGGGKGDDKPTGLAAAE
jgi:hypothetical protein